MKGEQLRYDLSCPECGETEIKVVNASTGRFQCTACGYISLLQDFPQLDMFPDYRMGNE